MCVTFCTSARSRSKAHAVHAQKKNARTTSEEAHKQRCRIPSRALSVEVSFATPGRISPLAATKLDATYCLSWAVRTPTVATGGTSQRASWARTRGPRQCWSERPRHVRAARAMAPTPAMAAAPTSTPRAAWALVPASTTRIAWSLPPSSPPRPAAAGTNSRRIRRSHTSPHGARRTPSPRGTARTLIPRATAPSWHTRATATAMATCPSLRSTRPRPRHLNSRTLYV